MFNNILVPIDLAVPDLAKQAIEAAVTLARASGGIVRLLNVLPPTPAMLTDYVPADFDVQQKASAREALDIVAKESGLGAGQLSTAVRQGGVHPEVLDEAAEMPADLIVMSSHQPAMKTYILGSNAAHVVRYAKCSVLVL